MGFLAGYTWSKAIGYVDQNGAASYYTVAQDYYNRGLERSVTSFNLPQSFKLTWVYDTPFGKGRRWDLHWLNPVLGGWQLSAIHNYQSGMPVKVSESGLNIPPGFAFGIRPDVLTGVPLNGSERFAKSRCPGSHPMAESRRICPQSADLVRHAFSEWGPRLDSSRPSAALLA